MQTLTNPYGLGMIMRRALYRSGVLKAAKVAAPVISVGNLTVGGTGKTPITKHVVQFLRDHCSQRVAIVMRGYKRNSKGLLVVSDGVTTFVDADLSGDEAQLYAEELADVIVVCDEDRVRGAGKAIELGATIIVLDDGYQHMAIHRDLNILLIAANEPQGAVLPMGRFRESTAASQDADVILITGKQGDDFAGAEHVISVFTLKPTVFVSRAILQPVSLTTIEGKELRLDSVSGKRVLAVSAIAKPERFHASIADLGAEAVPYILPDHSHYDEGIARDVLQTATNRGCEIIMQTSKDAVKSTPFFRAFPIPSVVLHIEYGIADEPGFFKRIRSILYS